MPKSDAVARWDPRDPRFKLPFSKPIDAINQAGGGSKGSPEVDRNVVEHFKDKILDCFEKIHDDLDHKLGVPLNKEEGVTKWATEIQKDPGILHDFFVADHEECLENFVTYMGGDNSSALMPFEPADDELDFPMTSYFISSSHNTYLTGNQLYGQSSIDGYKNVLLRGCRSVEIDVWNGEPDTEAEAEERNNLKRKRGPDMMKNLARTKSGSSTPSSEDAAPLEEPEPLEMPTPWKVPTNDAEPVVLHGYTATREVPFRTVCEAIRDYAFVTSSLPVIVSLEVHTNREQQQKMVDIMYECFKGLLCEPSDHGEDTAKEAAHMKVPSPIDLKHKVLIKVKYSPPKAEPEDLPTIVPEQLGGSKSSQESDTTLTTTISHAASDDEASKAIEKQPSAKPSKIIDALSKMGIYTRSCHFKNLQQTEASVPTHVFSLSESTLGAVHKQDPKGLFHHNQNFFMRAFPKGSRISSTNLDPSVFWRRGVQMVALNWQKWDAGMMLNEAMFAETAGWVLKPSLYREPLNGHEHANPDVAPQMPQTAGSAASSSLRVEIFCGQDLPLAKGVHDEKDLRPYIKMELHVEKAPELGEAKATRAKEGEYKQHTKTSKGVDPDFNRQVIEFADIPELIPQLSFVR